MNSRQKDHHMGSWSIYCTWNAAFSRLIQFHVISPEYSVSPTIRLLYFYAFYRLTSKCIQHVVFGLVRTKLESLIRYYSFIGLFPSNPICFVHYDWFNSIANAAHHRFDESELLEYKLPLYGCYIFTNSRQNISYIYVALHFFTCITSIF